MFRNALSVIRLVAAGLVLVVGPNLINPETVRAREGTCESARPDHLCLTTEEPIEGYYCTASGDDCLTCLAEENKYCTASGMGSHEGYKDFSEPGGGGS